MITIAIIIGVIIEQYFVDEYMERMKHGLFQTLTETIQL